MPYSIVSLSAGWHRVEQSTAEEAITPSLRKSDRVASFVT
jgi:hypothetical protein